LLTFTGEHLRAYAAMNLDGFENCVYTFGSCAPPAPDSNITEIKYECHAVSVGEKQGVINFSEELTHTFVVTVNVALAPSISSITPDSTVKSSNTLLVTLTGDNFTEDSQVYFDVNQRKSKIADADVQFINAQTLKFPVKPGLSGTWQITVRNDGADSNVISFNVTQPVIPTPVISSITPDSVTQSFPFIDLTITGSNFIEDSQVYSLLNGVTTKIDDAKVQLVSDGVLKISISLYEVGSIQFKVRNADKDSNWVNFTVDSLSTDPSVQSVSPLRAKLEELTTFVLLGKNLPDDVDFTLDGCIGITKLASSTRTEIRFTCTSTLKGSRRGVIKSGVSGVVLKNFTVNVYESNPAVFLVPILELLLD